MSEGARWLGAFYITLLFFVGSALLVGCTVAAFQHARSQYGLKGALVFAGALVAFVAAVVVVHEYL